MAKGGDAIFSLLDITGNVFWGGGAVGDKTGTRGDRWTVFFCCPRATLKFFYLPAVSPNGSSSDCSNSSNSNSGGGLGTRNGDGHDAPTTSVVNDIFIKKKKKKTVSQQRLSRQRYGLVGSRSTRARMCSSTDCACDNDIGGELATNTHLHGHTEPRLRPRRPETGSTRRLLGRL